MHQQLLKSPFTAAALSAPTFSVFSSFFFKAAHYLKVTGHLGNVSYNETCVHFFFTSFVCYRCLGNEPEAHFEKWARANEPRRFLTKENTGRHGILFLPEARWRITCCAKYVFCFCWLFSFQQSLFTLTSSRGLPLVFFLCVCVALIFLSAYHALGGVGGVAMFAPPFGMLWATVGCWQRGLEQELVDGVSWRPTSQEWKIYHCVCRKRVSTKTYIFLRPTVFSLKESRLLKQFQLIRELQYLDVEKVTCLSPKGASEWRRNWN